MNTDHLVHTWNYTDQGSTLTTTTEGIVKDPHPFPVAVVYLLLTLYAIVICLGICGNSLVCYLFASKRVQHKPINILLLNLSIADLLTGLFAIPFIAIDIKELRHLSSKNANLACAFTIGITPFFTVTVVSLLSICFISMTRYLQVSHPRAHSKVTSNCGLAIVISIEWLLGIGLPFPNYFSFVYNPKAAICQRDWPAGFHGGIFSAATAFIAIVLPIVSMLFTFLSTIRILRRFSTNDDGESSTSPLLNSTTVVKRKNAVKLLGSLIIVFIVCWCPFFIYWILSRAAGHVFPNGPQGDYNRMKVIRCCILVALCNTIADPIVYALRGEEFRKGFKEVLVIISSAIFVNSSSSATSRAPQDELNNAA